MRSRSRVVERVEREGVLGARVPKKFARLPAGQHEVVARMDLPVVQRRPTGSWPSTADDLGHASRRRWHACGTQPRMFIPTSEAASWEVATW